ncbi:MAG: YcxB family protein [Ruminococcus sp.]|nr:YcxB family protein [Ruminococcus sp.]
MPICEELFGGPATIKSFVTEDSVRALAPSGGTNEVAYNNVRRAIQTENLIFLQTKANLLYVFLKDGFTLGTAEEFIAFLKSKGIKVK